VRNKEKEKNKKKKKTKKTKKTKKRRGKEKKNKKKSFLKNDFSLFSSLLFSSLSPLLQIFFNDVAHEEPDALSRPWAGRLHY